MKSPILLPDSGLELTVTEISQPDWELLTPDTLTISSHYDSCGSSCGGTGGGSSCGGGCFCDCGTHVL